MKLYTHPGASSLHVHILLCEIGEKFDLEVINVTAKQRPDGSDYRAIAPRGMVPLLELDDGTSLTENIVIAQYICDRANRTDLMPSPGTMLRYRVMEWQSFVAAEMHKSFVPLFWPTVDDATRDMVFKRIEARLAFLEEGMVGPYLTGQTFTAADSYLFVIASWTQFFQMSLDPYPKVAAFLALARSRPAVQEALAAESGGMVPLVLVPLV